MKGRLLFPVATFVVGWILQAAFFSLAGVGDPTPHWLLLTVMAVGGMGRVNLAQGLGFFWGLALDAHGVSLFGSQALLMSTAGFAAGQLARELNTDKLITQEAMALVGSLYFFVGLGWTESLFRASGAVHHPGWGVLLLGVLLNALAAPWVFWLFRRWADLWGEADREAPDE